MLPSDVVIRYLHWPRIEECDQIGLSSMNKDNFSLSITVLEMNIISINQVLFCIVLYSQRMLVLSMKLSEFTISTGKSMDVATYPNVLGYDSKLACTRKSWQTKEPGNQ